MRPSFRTTWPMSACARAGSAGCAPLRAARRRCRQFSEAVRNLAHAFSYSYALGIHPLCCCRAAREQDLSRCSTAELAASANPMHAPGRRGGNRTGLFCARSCKAPRCASARSSSIGHNSNWRIKHELPVILHVRRSADKLLKHLRESGAGATWRTSGTALPTPSMAVSSRPTNSSN